MVKFLKALIVLSFLCSIACLVLGIKIFMDREVIKLRTQNLENNAEKVAQHLKYENAGSLKSSLVARTKEDAERMMSPLNQLASHAQLKQQTLEETENQLRETEAVLEQTRDALKSTEVQLAEARSQIEKLDADLARTMAELASAQNRVETLTTEKQGLMEEISALNDTIAQKENDILGYEADLASVTNERDRAEKELDLCLAQLQGTSGAATGDLAGLPASIIRVNDQWNFVVLDIGQTEGVLLNVEAIVFRGDEMIGKVRVTDVQENMCIADINRKYLKTTIQNGDRVVF
ncbi:MAG: DNA repair exonuclease SbcCD ATPase subunit [Kiritimatiellia bacterium]|jgi:DNA repair exonuclease SbcCD ATPase subunit